MVQLLLVLSYVLDICHIIRMEELRLCDIICMCDMYYKVSFHYTIILGMTLEGI